MQSQKTTHFMLKVATLHCQNDKRQITVKEINLKNHTLHVFETSTLVTVVFTKMGRKAKFENGVLVKRGPGKKAKKQSDPVFPKKLKGITAKSKLNSSIHTFFLFR